MTTTTTRISSIVQELGTSPLVALEYFGGFEADFDLEAIEAEYRAAIDAALPEGVSLLGDEFYGEYGVDYSGLDIAEIIESVDFDTIVARHAL